MADMKVLLRSDVVGVGKRGDIIDVSGGFARNHLLPAGKAIAATPGVEVQAAAMRKSRDLRDARDRESAETVARTLVGNTVNLVARAGSGGKLFGSISGADIVREVQAQTGAVVDRKDLVLEESIKTLGVHNVRVELLGGVVFELTIDVVALGDPPPCDTPLPSSQGDRNCPQELAACPRAIPTGD